MHLHNRAHMQAVVGCVGIFWAVSSGTLSLSTLPSLGIQLNNTFGLFCVLVLLGYGLVAIPKHLWKRSDPSLELRRQLYRCGHNITFRFLHVECNNRAGPYLCFKY